ncbi:MAG: glycosyltransferase family 2 protein [Christiangramia sp.]|uniref:glycosyltransferase family 2 protein n=1 Tax=Christiangramia sp. TaxID=1931228 RepID=UPI003241E5FB
MLPKISIVVPNYNHAPFLKERLETIFNQTYQNFEVILLDDASTDNSLEILQQYSKHSKVSYFIKNEVNSGSPFVQWKKGIDLASGDYIWIAESDDYCNLNFLEKILKHIDSKTGLAYCASINVNSKNEILGINTWASELHNKRWNRDFTNSGSNEVKLYLKFRNTIPNASSVVFKAEIVKKIEFPINMYFCGDWYIWLKILEKGNITYLSEALNYFRKHEKSTRQIASLEREIDRFQEYMQIIKLNSSFFLRLKKMKNYNWILKEWEWKKEYFKKHSIFKLNLPIEFLLYYWTRIKL